jgi:hypothetical protein
MYGRGEPQYCGCLASLRWLLGTYSSSLYGPVPMACVSSFSLSIAPCWMMAELRRMAKAPSKGGKGALVENRTVYRSRVSTRSTWSKLERHTAGPLGSRTMSKVYLTSSAVNSVPSCHFTPRRRWKM